MAYRPDETFHRLQEWTDGQAQAEKLAAQILYAEGFRDVDPSHPFGGPDGLKDALAAKDGKRWVMAAYFPRRQKPFGEIERKFAHDLAGIAANAADGIAFVTNQELTLSQRETLAAMTSGPVELMHVYRVVTVLDRPDMHPVRAQFLYIDAPAGATAPEPRGLRDVIEGAPVPPGAPAHRMLYDGILVLQVVVAADPPARHPAGDVRRALAAADAAAREVASDWPESASLLLRRLADDWAPVAPHQWGAGRSGDDAERLATTPTAAIAFDSRTCALRMDRSWPTSVHDDYGRLVYYAAREPEVAAELLVTLAVAGDLLQALSGATAMHVAVRVSAAPRGKTLLVSSERAVSGGRFGEPDARIVPTEEVPGYHEDAGRFSIADVRDAFAVAGPLLGPWLIQFRDDDLLASLRRRPRPLVAFR